MNERTSREMQAGLEETRAEMDQTIDEIQRRISPSEIIDQVLWHVRSGGGRTVAEGAGEFTSNLVRTIRENPVPSLLIGTGLAWFVVANMRGQRRSGHEEDDYLYDQEVRRRARDETALPYGERMRRDEGSVVRDPDSGAAGHRPATPSARRPTTASAPEPDPHRTPTVEAVRAADPHAPFGHQKVDAGPVSHPDRPPARPQDDPRSATERARRSVEEARERAERATSTTRKATGASPPQSGLHRMSTVEAVRAADPHAPFSPRSVDAKHPKH